MSDRTVPAASPGDVGQGSHSYDPAAAILKPLVDRMYEILVERGVIIEGVPKAFSEESDL